MRFSVVAVGVADRVFPLGGARLGTSSPQIGATRGGGTMRFLWDL